MQTERLLLHVCCVGCFLAAYKVLSQSYKLMCLFYNPNIHPSTEYKKRLDAFCQYAKMAGIAYTVHEYELDRFLKEVLGKDERCRHCYTLRLKESALYAKENGYSLFCTTLLSSPRQRHNILKEVGESIQNNMGIFFLYKDFRPNFAEAIKSAKERGLYLQKYCGCIWSEKRRFFDGPKRKD
jgi:hypothetical protein